VSTGGTTLNNNNSPFGFDIPGNGANSAKNLDTKAPVKVVSQPRNEPTVAKPTDDTKRDLFVNHKEGPEDRQVRQQVANKTADIQATQNGDKFSKDRGADPNHANLASQVGPSREERERRTKEAGRLVKQTNDGPIKIQAAITSSAQPVAPKDESRVKDPRAKATLDELLKDLPPKTVLALREKHKIPERVLTNPSKEELDRVIGILTSSLENELVTWKELQTRDSNGGSRTIEDLATGGGRGEIEAEISGILAKGLGGDVGKIANSVAASNYAKQNALYARNQNKGAKMTPPTYEGQRSKPAALLTAEYLNKELVQVAAPWDYAFAA
jgi:hypothetical protein